MKLISLRPIDDLKHGKKTRFGLMLLFGIWTFLVLLAVLAIVFGFMIIMVNTGKMSVDSIWESMTLNRLLLYTLLLSIVIGAVISLLSGRLIIKPINSIVDAMNHIAAGNFKTRIDFDGVLANHPALQELRRSINTMAEELEHTELLRSGFVNDFSHEFKTPIVSISGFAKLLKNGDLTEEQRTEYIDIIEKESRRLASMATNVINLSRIENQTILTEQTSFNLSEQIRESFLLLENKWVDRNLDLVLQFDEFTVTANEELMKQVWINLLDNAIKFTPDGGTIIVDIKKEPPFLKITISNTGSSIAPENIGRIFQKFYQEDASHATDGSGIGLAIVKRIIDLHRGGIEVSSKDGLTSFFILLPENGD